MGWIGIPLDVMTITIAAITIGIAVDNGIHYIYRFREEFATSGDHTAPLHVCHANIGCAVFYTSTTVIFGFSILILSNFLPTIYFGVLTGPGNDKITLRITSKDGSVCYEPETGIRIRVRD